MALGEVARLCRVGEGRTSSGLNSGSSAKRSSKYVSDKTLHTENTVIMSVPSPVIRWFKYIGMDAHFSCLRAEFCQGFLFSVASLPLSRCLNRENKRVSTLPTHIQYTMSFHHHFMKLEVWSQTKSRIRCHNVWKSVLNEIDKWSPVQGAGSPLQAASGYNYRR